MHTLHFRFHTLLFTDSTVHFTSDIQNLHWNENPCYASCVWTSVSGTYVWAFGLVGFILFWPTWQASNSWIMLYQLDTPSGNFPWLSKMAMEMEIVELFLVDLSIVCKRLPEKYDESNFRHHPATARRILFRRHRASAEPCKSSWIRSATRPAFCFIFV